MRWWVQASKLGILAPPCFLEIRLDKPPARVQEHFPVPFCPVCYFVTLSHCALTHLLPWGCPEIRSANMHL